MTIKAKTSTKQIRELAIAEVDLASGGHRSCHPQHECHGDGGYHPGRCHNGGYNNGSSSYPSYPHRQY